MQSGREWERVCVDFGKMHGVEHTSNLDIHRRAKQLSILKNHMRSSIPQRVRLNAVNERLGEVRLLLQKLTN